MLPLTKWKMPIDHSLNFVVSVRINARMHYTDSCVFMLYIAVRVASSLWTQIQQLAIIYILKMCVHACTFSNYS